MNYKKSGFTLAEVLITLGIIGIVAAMTIPALMTNIAATKNRARFKKTISALNQAVKMSTGKYDLNFANATTMCTNPSDTAENAPSICGIFNSTMTGVTFYASAGSIRPSTVNQKYYYNTNSAFRKIVGDARYYAGFVLQDGTIVAINSDARECSKDIGQALTPEFLTQAKSYWYGGGHGLNNCSGFIDVNGPAGPNREVSCSNGQATSSTPETPCIVNLSDTGDIFPVVFYNDVVVPSTNASAYILKNTK